MLSIIGSGIGTVVHSVEGAEEIIRGGEKEYDFYNSNMSRLVEIESFW